MKELEVKSKEEIVIAAQKQQQKELKLVASLRPYQGHTCFEWNIETGKIIIAEFTTEAVAYPVGKKADLQATVRKRILVREKCLYTTALNKKNAIKRFKKMVDENQTSK